MVKPTRQREGDLRQPTLLLVGDLVSLELAFLATYWLRFSSGLLPTPLGVPALSTYVWTSLVLLVLWAGLFMAHGLYDPERRHRLEDDAIGLFKVTSLGSLVVLALAFFFRGFSYSRSFFVLFYLAALLFLLLGRIGTRELLKRQLRRGIGVTRVLFVGKSPMRQRLLETFQRLPGLGYVPVGEVPEPGGEPAGDELEVLGELSDIEEIVERGRIDLVLLALPFDRLSLAAELADRLGPLHVDVQLVPDLARLHTSRLRLREIAGLPFVGLRQRGLSGMDRIVKRSFDMLASGLALLLLSPLLLLLAALVKLSSPGPVLFRQDRLGRDNREFGMLKFRTMRVDAEAESGPVWTVEGDPRKTAIGSFLRRFSLDELPQLWNVLRGDMSLVGPRPEREHFARQFQGQVPRYLERHRVRSGLTGWAQVHGLRGNTPVELRTLFDLHYVENWSLWLDLRIILKTVVHVLRGENAY